MFAIIIAIVAAVLSLAAPVRVEAQTPSVGLNKIGQTWYDYVGLTPGATLSYGSCFGASSHPAACAFDSKGNAAGGAHGYHADPGPPAPRPPGCSLSTGCRPPRHCKTRMADTRSTVTRPVQRK